LGTLREGMPAKSAVTSREESLNPLIIGDSGHQAPRIAQAPRSDYPIEATEHLGISFCITHFLCISIYSIVSFTGFFPVPETAVLRELLAAHI